MANGPEPELAKHAPRTSSHTSLKQEHQSTSIYTQESESPTPGLKNKAKTSLQLCFPFNFTLHPCQDRTLSFAIFSFIKLLLLKGYFDFSS